MRLTHRAAALFAALLACIIALPATAQEAGASKRIAITFDDIPRHPGGFMNPDERAIRIIAGLAEAGVEQAGFFVTPGNLERPGGDGGEARIRAYVAAGHVIANHSWSHSSLNRSSPQDYLADLDGAQEWLAGRPGARPWFRYPYLHEGPDFATRDAVRAGLAERGLLNAYITVDSRDWFVDNLAIEAAREGRDMDMDALRDIYVGTVVRAANFNDATLRRAIGSSPAHVLLLHETDLAGLFIADLVEALRADGWDIVTVDEAYADPIAASEPDTLFLGAGRAVALGHVAGGTAATLLDPAMSETVLQDLFANTVLLETAP